MDRSHFSCVQAIYKAGPAAAAQGRRPGQGVLECHVSQAYWTLRLAGRDSAGTQSSRNVCVFLGTRGVKHPCALRLSPQQPYCGRGEHLPAVPSPAAPEAGGTGLSCQEGLALCPGWQHSSDSTESGRQVPLGLWGNLVGFWPCCLSQLSDVWFPHWAWLRVGPEVPAPQWGPQNMPLCTCTPSSPRNPKAMFV